MSKIKSLLVATDFSDDARQAVLRAAFLAAEQGAQLGVLHVMSGWSLNSLRELFKLSSDADTKLIDDAKRMLDELVDDVAEKTKLTAAPKVRVGDVVNEIISASGQADMLVLGARGLNPLRDLLLGTTAENLLRKCKCPILVNKRPPHGSYQRVIVPVDLSPHSIAALRIAVQVAPQADITIIHAFDVPFEGKLWLAGVEEQEIHRYRIQARLDAHEKIETLMQNLDNTSLRLHTIIEHGDAARVILEQEEAASPDLIVIGKHGQSVVGELLLGSVTRHVLSNARCDVLVVNE